MNSENTYAVYLAATNNIVLGTRLDNGEIIEGMLEINYAAGEISFTFGERVAFRYNEIEISAESFSFSDGNTFFRFTKERPDTVKVVKQHG